MYGTVWNVKFAEQVVVLWSLLTCRTIDTNVSGKIVSWIRVSSQYMC
jgi:hypothetical protein